MKAPQTNDYIITYTFSEEVVGIKANDFTITAGGQTITPTIQHNGDTVTLTIVTDEETAQITVKDFIDTSKNVGIEYTSELALGKLTVTSANSTITDNEIEASGDNYTFVLRFTGDVSVDEFTIDDFTTTNTNIDIIDIITTAVDGIITNATIEFKINTPNNTANIDITIDTGAIGNADQTNDEPIVISIDRAPRVVSIPKNSQTEFSSDIISSGISYTFTFSEAINGLEVSDFVITPDNSGVSIQIYKFR